MRSTILKKMVVEKFRNMSNVEIDFGERLTVISGKNGTAKSTILGLVAQIFSFDKDHASDQKVDYETLSGKQFKSKFSEHFRLSEAFDKPGEMSVIYDVYDAYFKQNIENLKLTMPATSGRSHRAVVRNNLPTATSTNTSRNVTHPLIYLSLKRLIPVADRNDDKVYDLEYLKKNQADFVSCCNEIIGKDKGTHITSTKGTIDSSVVHGQDYDHESVSSGEDNVGQIVQALFSFKRLKEEYSDYHGGILIIDELDAGLFPFAQDRIIDVLIKYSNKYNIQTIISSHSPTIIEKVFEKSENEKGTKENNFKSIFLTDSHGKLQVRNDYSWSDIYADLHIKTKRVSDEISLPIINIYFEDKEAVDFFNRLVTNRKIRKIINPLKDVSMGCKDYLKLVKHKIPEFSENSIIVLDADVIVNSTENKSIILLPGTQPPDRLIFSFLYNLPKEDDFWKNNIGYNKTNFIANRCTQEIIKRLSLNNYPEGFDFNFDEIIEKELNNNETNAIRSVFKNFYNDSDFQKLFKTIKNNPIEYFLKKNPHMKSDFEELFINKTKDILIKDKRVQKSDIYTYFT